MRRTNAARLRRPRVSLPRFAAEASPRPAVRRGESAEPHGVRSVHGERVGRVGEAECAGQAGEGDAGRGRRPTVMGSGSVIFLELSHRGMLLFSTLSRHGGRCAIGTASPVPTSGHLPASQQPPPPS